MLGLTGHVSGTCWLSSMSSASPPLRGKGMFLRAAVLICLWGAGTVFGAVGDVLIGPSRRRHLFVDGLPCFLSASHCYLLVSHAFQEPCEYRRLERLEEIRAGQIFI